MSERQRRTPMGQADAKASNRLLVGIGVGLVTAVTGLSVAGTYSAINAMNRQSEEQIAAANAAAEQAKNPPVSQQPSVDQTRNTVDPGTTQQPSDSQNPTTTEPPKEEIKYASEQIKWMNENNIRYDEYGLPVDASGNLVDDPTTNVYDPARRAYFFNEDGTPKTPYITELPTEKPDYEPENVRPTTPYVEEPTTTSPPTDEHPSTTEPDTPPAEEQIPNPQTSDDDAWWFDENGNLLEGLQLDENGKPYYVVVPGDWLSRIARKYGFGDDYWTLAELSHIEDPNLIYAGNIIRFPDTRPGDGQPTVTEGSQAPGRG